MTQRISIAEAKARFAEFVRRAERGETVVLTRHGRPVAELAPTAAAGDQGQPASREIREATSRYETNQLQSPSTATPEALRSRRESLAHLLEDSIWPRVPENQHSTAPDRSEREKILGYGREGV